MGHLGGTSVLVIATTVIAGCGPGAPDCATVAKHVSALSPSGQLEAAKAVCAADRWSAGERQCLSKATDAAAAVACLRRPADHANGYRRSEADVSLQAIARAADLKFTIDGAFPSATAPLTPAASCCDGKNRKCWATAADWSREPAWTALGFQMPTESFYFQYTYSSDGRSYEAQAVADLDCDSITVTYALHGTVEAGVPHASLDRPARAD